MARRPRADFRVCGDLACSEIRAAFWGECRRLSDPAAKRACVMEVATRATEVVQNLFPGVGSRVVSARFDECFRNQAPWEDQTPSLSSPVS